MTILCILSLTACSTSQEPSTTITKGKGILEPADETLKSSLKTFFQNSEAPIASTYDFHRTDLNNDGRRDAIALMRSPYGYWCDEYGCKMLILKAGDHNFEIVNAIQPVREPIFIAPTTTNGWKNIALRVSGRQEKAKNVVLQFNGNHYPENPNLISHTRNLPLKSFERIFTREGT